MRSIFPWFRGETEDPQSFQIMPLDTSVRRGGALNHVCEQVNDGKRPPARWRNDNPFGSSLPEPTRPGPRD